MRAWDQVQFRGKLHETVLARPTELRSLDRRDYAAGRPCIRAAAVRLSGDYLHVFIRLITPHPSSGTCV